MFANKGRLKVALLVVGVLVTSLGMYAGFQVQDAYGHGSAAIQRNLVDTTIQKETKETTKQVKCWACNTAWRTKTKKTTKTKTETQTTHMHLTNDGKWSVQSKKINRTSSETSQNSWSPCSHIYPGGGKCAG